MFLLQASAVWLGAWMGSEQQARGFGEGPLEIRGPALGSCGPAALASGCLRTLDEATRGEDILAPGEAMHLGGAL
jgi:hypothetical protein